MAKKEGGFDFASILKSGMISGAIDFVKDAKNKVIDFVLFAEEKAVQLLSSAALFITGAIFISVAAVLLLNEFLGLSKGLGYLIIGLILIIAALITKNRALSDLNKRR